MAVRMRAAFTLVELLIVVAVIGLNGSDVRMLDLSMQPTKLERSGTEIRYFWNYENLLFGRPVQVDVLGIAPIDRLGDLTWLGPLSTIPIMSITQASAIRPSMQGMLLTCMGLLFFIVAMSLMPKIDQQGSAFCGIPKPRLSFKPKLYSTARNHTLRQPNKTTLRNVTKQVPSAETISFRLVA